MRSSGGNPIGVPIEAWVVGCLLHLGIAGGLVMLSGMLLRRISRREGGRAAGVDPSENIPIASLATATSPASSTAPTPPPLPADPDSPRAAAGIAPADLLHTRHPRGRTCRPEARRPGQPRPVARAAPPAHEQTLAGQALCDPGDRVARDLLCDRRRQQPRRDRRPRRANRLRGHLQRSALAPRGGGQCDFGSAGERATPGPCCWPPR